MYRSTFSKVIGLNLKSYSFFSKVHFENRQVPFMIYDKYNNFKPKSKKMITNLFWRASSDSD